ncbi:hypothetical protein [uncultured Draconibacterium sp.]|uniref:hypothetical protein n=1 Tax=uncultured Draconibacterium sp. TaxID=1573823 RepID=UPI0025DC4CB4|nr:hypothetical protein [uncultured Draconibacterium sp.]
MRINFKEEQKFTQWWFVWLIIILIAIIPIYGIYKQLILGDEFGNNPMSDTGLIVFSILMFALIGLFLLIKLKTTINDNEIRMSFFPFVKKKIKWDKIKKAEVVNYGFVGGWGIRIWTKYGVVYNVRGNKGLAIELSNGKKLLIGTQKEAELRRAIEMKMKKI